MSFYNYEYFSGANVEIEFKNADLDGEYKKVYECAGISYSIQNSQQPIYGYASTQFDAMLPGREIVQGNFVANYVKPDYILTDILENPAIASSGALTYNGFLTNAFDIKIRFGTKSEIIIKTCYIISRGQTVQISEQVLLEEYGFLGRSIDFKNK
tara:strand:- start:14826 stop:15290 length:465 start_codon:yes stop_codon:yes gene_type:complete